MTPGLNKEPGMTIIEILITLSMLGFVIAAIYSFYLSGLSGWNRGTEQMEYQQTARIAMDKMIREIRFAYRVKFTDQGRCSIEHCSTFERNRSYDLICFRAKKDPSDSKPTLFRFRLDRKGGKGQLFFDQRTDNNNHYATNVVALNITSLEFLVDNDDLLHITISAGKNNKEVTLTGSVRPRNLDFGKE